jgi:hypothetical protein
MTRYTVSYLIHSNKVTEILGEGRKVSDAFNVFSHKGAVFFICNSIVYYYTSLIVGFMQ